MIAIRPARVDDRQGIRDVDEDTGAHNTRGWRVNGMDISELQQRFDLRRTQYLCERFEKSPHITEKCSVAGHLSICYGDRDTSIVPSVQDVLLGVYAYVKDWFDYRGDLAIELWMAPETVDLQYRTCLPCDDCFACAPGTRDGMNVILIVSPLAHGRNADKGRLSAVLAHEITHHFVTDISHSTIFAMKRRERQDVPMWLEEGLAALIMGEVYPALRQRFDEAVAGTREWYPLEDMWHDLSSCEDANRAYLQAYRETRALVERMGKGEVIRLLYLNRTHYVNWNDLARKGRAPAKGRNTNDWRPQE
jgi:hypothetical protein